MQLAFYGTYGGATWLPFPPPPPPPEPVTLLAQESVAGLGTVVCHLFVDESLPDEVARAESDNTIVVIVVDPSSLRVKQLSDVLGRCDSRLHRNWAVLVPWNRADPDVSRDHDTLLEQVEKVFRNHTSFHLPYFVHRTIESRDALKKALVDAILGARGRLSETSANYRKAVAAPEASGMARANPIGLAGDPTEAAAGTPMEPVRRAVAPMTGGMANLTASPI